MKANRSQYETPPVSEKQAAESGKEGVQSGEKAGARKLSQIRISTASSQNIPSIKPSPNGCTRPRQSLASNGVLNSNKKGRKSDLGLYLL
jgi:hypothetical protein